MDTSKIITEIDAEIAKLQEVRLALIGLVSTETATSKATKTKRRVSAAARRKMSLAQKARWAKVSPNVQPSAKPKRVMSASARRKIAAAQRARGAKVKAKKVA